MTPTAPPVSIEDPVNARILVVSEDRISGFHRRPFDPIAQAAGVDLPTVLARIRAMLEVGTIRRVRQTLLSGNLAPGALVAWRVPEDRLAAAFEWIFANDPFSGHVVIRTADADAAGSDYRLWTTLKVPQGYSLQRHCAFLARRTGAEDFKLIVARKVFALGVGHVRRRGLSPGDMAAQPAAARDIREVDVSDFEWQVLAALKHELVAREIVEDPWAGRAREAGLTIERFCGVCQDLDQRGVIGRFSTFLEHKKPMAGGAVTQHNGLFHWAVPAGREVEAGGEIGRFAMLTHVYWRDAGRAFNHVNIMAVAHATDRQRVLEVKAAIDRHLAAIGMPCTYSAVFWGQRSEIKPSEIIPAEYPRWCQAMGLDPATLRTDD